MMSFFYFNNTILFLCIVAIIYEQRFGSIYVCLLHELFYCNEQFVLDNRRDLVF